MARTASRPPRTSHASQGFAGVRRMLHVNDKGGRFGGTEEYISSVASALAPFGVRSSLAYGETIGEPGDATLDAVRIPALARRNRPGAAVVPLLDLVERIRPDLVYLHNIFDHRIPLVLDYYPRDYGIVWYIHDHYLDCLTELRTKRDGESLTACDAPLSRMCLAEVAAGRCALRTPDASYGAPELRARQELLGALTHVDAAVVVSGYMGRKLAAHAPSVAPKLHVLSRQIRDAPAPAARDPNAPRVLFAGRIARSKGLHVVIEALAETDLPRPTRLVIAGPIEDAAYWDECRRLSRAATERNRMFDVEYAGHVDHAALDALYARAHIVVVPSQAPEPLGVVPAEAVLHGAAVVASNVGGLPTWFPGESTGLLVDPDNRRKWSRAISALLADEGLRRRLAGSGARLIRERHTAERHLTELARVVGRIRARPPSSGGRKG